MMYEEYQELFRFYKKEHPKKYSEKINIYLINMKKIVQENPLVKMAIITSFKEEEHIMKKIFPHLYKEISFSKLTDRDIQKICDEYVAEVELIAKEVANDI